MYTSPRRSSKSILVVLLAAAGAASVLTGCSKSGESDPAAVDPPKPGPDEVVKAFEVTGMTCSGCESHVRDEVEKLAKVKSAKASHTAERVWIVAAKEDGPSDEDVISAIRKAGEPYAAKAVAPTKP